MQFARDLVACDGLFPLFGGQLLRSLLLGGAAVGFAPPCFAPGSGSRDLVALSFAFPRGLFPQPALGLLLPGPPPACLLRASLFSGVLRGDPPSLCQAYFPPPPRGCLWHDTF